MRILIKARRNGYSPEQCGKTMTVRELIDFLDDFKLYENAKIYFSFDNGYTFGEIRESDFESEDENEEESSEDECNE